MLAASALAQTATKPPAKPATAAKPAAARPPVHAAAPAARRPVFVPPPPVIELDEAAVVADLPTALDTDNRDRYRRIFDQECKRHGMTLSDDVFAVIVYKIKKEKELEFAAFQPRFILDQVVATCRFMGERPHLEPRFIDYAIDNLRVKRGSSSGTT